MQHPSKNISINDNEYLTSKSKDKVLFVFLIIGRRRKIAKILTTRATAAPIPRIMGSLSLFKSPLKKL